MSAARCGRGRSSLALGPHPQRELTLTPRRGFPCPRLGVAAGALHWGRGPTTVFLSWPRALAGPSNRGGDRGSILRRAVDRAIGVAAGGDGIERLPRPRPAARLRLGIGRVRRGVTRPVGERGRRRESRD